MKTGQSKNILISLLYAVFVAVFSYFMYAVYIGQDLKLYAYYYNNLPNKTLSEAFLFYRNTLGSKEPVYFIITFLAHDLVSKEVLMSLSNSFLAYFISRLILNANINILVWFMVVTNYYLWVLYLPAERLKFGLMFILAAILYSRRRYFFYLLSVMSHIQSFISIYILLSFKVKYYISHFLRKPVHSTLSFLLMLTFIFSLLYIMKDQLVMKFEAYYNKEFDFYGALKVVLFMFLSVLSFRNYIDKLSLAYLFLPLVILSLLLGGDRIVMFAAVTFIGMSVYYKKGNCFSFYLVSIYFLAKSIEFFYNTFSKGYAF